MADTATEIDLDSVIERLIEVRGNRPGKTVKLQEYEIQYLCTRSREIFMSQPMLLELEAPIHVCGESESPCPTLGNHTATATFTYSTAIC